MKAIGDMSTREVFEELDELQAGFTSDDYDRLETELLIKAAALHWTGDPLQQPPRAILAAARAVKEHKPATLQSALP